MAEFRGRLRLATREIDGNMPLPKAIARVKGVGTNLADSLARVIAGELGVDKFEKIGNLDETQTEKVEEILKNPTKYGIPAWMINRRQDRETGSDIHLVESDLDFTIKQDKDFEMTIRSYRGSRYMYGQRVRGQRTKNTGRKGTTLGVQRKKQQPQKKKPASGAKKK